MRGLGWLLLATGLLVAGSPAATTVALAAPTNAVAVVVDTGAEVKRVCVRFTEPHLSGIEVLRRAGVDPVFAEFGIGTAVCALCGVGCPSADCFCESERSGRFWNYSRAEDGRWVWSQLGASETVVRHGDMEGWTWAEGGAVPEWVAFETVCPPLGEPTATQEATAATATPQAAPAGAAPTFTPSGTTAPTPPPTATATLPGTPAPEPSSPPAAPPGTPPGTAPAAPLAVGDGGDGGGALARFGAVLGVLGMLFLFLRRRA